jgi:plasmid stabilization system protein ParE
MTYTVITLPQAEQEFEQRHAYIAKRSESGAASWANAFYTALKELESHPLATTLAPESADHPEEIRQLLFRTRRGRTYRALFIVRDQSVFVLHIRGPGQDIMRHNEIDTSQQP